MALESILHVLLFILIAWTLVSFFLIWQWFDARDRLKVVRETTRDETVRTIKANYEKCNKLIYIGAGIACVFIFLPFLVHDYYGTLNYSGVVIVVDVLVWFGLRAAKDNYLNSVDEYVNANEEHVREAAAERERIREEWRRQAPELNQQAKAQIKEALGDKYDVWFKHDILTGRDVLANMDEEVLYAQGVIIPFKEIMEVRPGRKDLKLVTSNSMHPFVTIDFGALPINPETGNKYMDEIGAKLEKILG
jgi:hypothetical protein